jgi:hypothetical protein
MDFMGEDDDDDDDEIPIRNHFLVDVDSATAAQDGNVIIQQNAACPPKASARGATTSFLHFYDTHKAEQEMLMWLKDNQLGKAVVDKMIELGAHSIEDAVSIFGGIQGAGSHQT